MPYIHSQTNVNISEEKETVLREKLGRAISLIPGKSEAWLMLRFDGGCRMAFRGEADPTAMIEVNIYGTASDGTLERMTGALTDIFSEELSIPKDRIYVKYEFCDHWGWQGENF